MNCQTVIMIMINVEGDFVDYGASTCGGLGSFQNLALIPRLPELFLGAPQMNFSLLPQLFLLSPYPYQWRI